MKANYDKIGTNYNSTRQADPFLTQKLMEHLNPDVDGIYLDIGCGTGNYTIELDRRGLRLIGIDPSVRMLEKARSSSSDIDWRAGRVEDIELTNNYVDGIIASLTIHHWTDMQKGFSELHRVLKPEGRMVIFTSTPKQMEGYWLNHYFPKMLKDSMVQMPSFESVRTMMNLSNFEIIRMEKYFIQPDLRDNFLYCGKHNPVLYFDEEIRRGISSFAALANQGEVDEGLRKLKKDMEAGRLDEVIDAYENDHGDYVYIVGRGLPVEDGV